MLSSYCHYQAASVVKHTYMALDEGNSVECGNGG